MREESLHFVNIHLADAFLSYCRADINSELMKNFSQVISTIKIVIFNATFESFIEALNQFYVNETLGEFLQVITKI